MSQYQMRPRVYTSSHNLERTAVDQKTEGARSFPRKLHALLEDAERKGYDDIICWQPGGRSFRVMKPGKFVSTIMPSFFKQTKYKSFQRQLNIYGFHRLHHGANKGGYAHALFIKGHPDLAKKIQRQPDAKAVPVVRKAPMYQEPAMPMVSSLGSLGDLFRNNNNGSVAIQSNEPFSIDDFHRKPMVPELTTSMLDLLKMDPATEPKQYQQQQQPQMNAQWRVEDRHPYQVHGTADGLRFDDRDMQMFSDLFNDRGNAVPPPMAPSLPPQYPAPVSPEPSSDELYHLINDADNGNGPAVEGVVHRQNEYTFPYKLHQMLQDAHIKGFDNVVSWVEGGTAFKVHDTEAFVKRVMPTYFDQTKYESFRRQLNLYSFTRVSRGPKRGIYFHQFFHQRDRSLCSHITRPKSSSRGSRE